MGWNDATQTWRAVVAAQNSKKRNGKREREGGGIEWNFRRLFALHSYHTVIKMHSWEKFPDNEKAWADERSGRWQREREREEWAWLQWRAHTHLIFNIRIMNNEPWLWFYQQNQIVQHNNQWKAFKKHKAFCHLHYYHRYHCGLFFYFSQEKLQKCEKFAQEKNIKIWKYVILTAFYYKPLRVERLMWSCLCFRTKIFANFQHNAIHTIILFIIIIIIQKSSSYWPLL